MRIVFAILWLLLTGATYDIRDFGATPGDGVDDGPALRAATAAAHAAGGGTVYIPAGVWDVTNAGCYRWCTLRIEGMADITVQGDGHGSVIRTMPGSYTGDWFVIDVRDSDRVSIRDLAFDGNRYGISSADEQTHQIQITYSRDVQIDNVLFERSWGDGVRVLGDETEGVGAPCERVSVTNSIFRDSRRNGITVQRAWRGGSISNNEFRGMNDGAIDFEPTGCATSADDGCTGPLLIAGNRIHQAGNFALAVTLTGSTGVQFIGNLVEGHVQGVHVRNAVIANNVIDARSTTSHRPLLHVIRNSYRVIVANNVLRGGGGKEVGVSFAYNNGTAPHEIYIRGNDISNVQTGVHLIGVQWARVEGNAIDAWEVGIYAESRLDFVVDALQVYANLIRGAKYGIFFVAGDNDVLRSAIRLNSIFDWSRQAIRLSARPGRVMEVSSSDNLL